MHKFKLASSYKPIPEQERAIEKLVKGVESGEKYQVLVGVTGSGKTYSVANVIERLQRPAIIISHNKTLAGQLYQEFRDFFPDNAVSYFVSYYDYYQPEAYIPSTDTYIEKDADVNELIDKLRLAATTNILTRSDTVVIASVSSIYNIGSPKEYGNYVLELQVGQEISREAMIERMLDLQYDRGDFGFHRGTFRVRGDSVDIYPAYQDVAIEIETVRDKITSIKRTDPLTGKLVDPGLKLTNYVLFPAKHFITDPNTSPEVFERIEKDLNERVEYFKKHGKDLEAHRLAQKVKYDIDMIKEVGYVKGIENYSRYFDGRKPGDPPYSLLDYFAEAYGDEWLPFVDESHITFPQIRGMYNGDRARKKTLIEYGFRLPSALDNRPLQFDEFMRRIPLFIATSATPGDWELSLAGNAGRVEQLVRPTGIPDPEVDVRETKSQVADVIKEVKMRAGKGQRSLITTLTKRMAEDLAEYLDEQGLKVHYLHSDVATLDRGDILDDLRLGKYDALVGINLLREGLDLPEVSLVAILDADKEGFLRSDVTLIQTMGRAARHVDGRVIMYADRETGSMKRALDEVRRRRKYQIRMNEKYGIKPTPIKKPIREKLIEREAEEAKYEFDRKAPAFARLPEIDIDSLTPLDRKKLVNNLRREMRLAANDLNFELAAAIRDRMRGLEGQASDTT